MRRPLVVIWLLFFVPLGLSAQKTVFENVKIRRHRSTKKRLLADKFGRLTFDDSARKLTFKKYGDDKIDDKIEIPYDDVEKVVSEVTTHMRAGRVARSVTFLEFPLGAIAASIIAGAHVNSHWLYLRYRSGSVEVPVLVEMPQATSEQIATKASAVFGARMEAIDFPEKAADIKPTDLKGLNSKQVVKVDAKNHPLPEIKPDKATLVVVCPTLPAWGAGLGSDFRLFADGEVVAVNRFGTYTFAYLDPGKHRLVSQGENANGFEMDLEAGREYFFLQNTFESGLSMVDTVLSRNSPELVNYLVDGSYFSDWKPKAEKKKHKP